MQKYILYIFFLQSGEITLNQLTLQRWLNKSQTEWMTMIVSQMAAYSLCGVLLLTMFMRRVLHREKCDISDAHHVFSNPANVQMTFVLLPFGSICLSVKVLFSGNIYLSLSLFDLYWPLWPIIKQSFIMHLLRHLLEKLPISCYLSVLWICNNSGVSTHCFTSMGFENDNLKGQSGVGTLFCGPFKLMVTSGNFVFVWIPDCSFNGLYGLKQWNRVNNASFEKNNEHLAMALITTFWCTIIIIPVSICVCILFAPVYNALFFRHSKMASQLRWKNVSLKIRWQSFGSWCEMNKCSAVKNLV